MDVEKWLEQLHLQAGPDDPIRAVHWTEARPARYRDVSPPLLPAVQQALERRGIHQLYVHQALAIEHARAGRHVAVATETASGKSLAYHVPVLEALLMDPRATALYLFPTKALAQDQLRTLLELLEALGPGAVRGRRQHGAAVAGTYDGDTPPDQRKQLRECGRVLLTNPDMLHAGMLGHHVAWGAFWRGLRYVAVDEMHVYRGLFGSHVANVLRRLQRVARHWGASPVFVLCSATIGNPREMASRLIGQPVELVDEDGSPRGRRCMILWNPPRVGHPPARRSANLEAADLMSRLVADGIPTIAFGRARVVAELLYRYTRERLERLAPSRANRIAAYRGGYLAAERREIERRLFQGELLGVCSTSALELGIDVGALEAAILVGYPGSIASVRQQAGRAGRKQETGLAVLVAHESPVDQYLANHPEYLWGRASEPGVLDPDNPQVILGHLRAATYELPLSPQELERFGPHAGAVLRLLVEGGDLFWDGRTWRWKGSGYPAGAFGLRTASEATYTIMEAERPGAPGGRVIGSLDEPSAFFQLHPEAVYLHEGETFVVDRLDLEAKVAWVRRQGVDYFTQAVAEQRVRPVVEAGPLLARRIPGGTAQFGDAVVTQLVYMFKKVRFESRDSLGWGRVELPPTEIYTNALALTPDPGAVAAVTAMGAQPVDALWGVANAVVGVLPLFAGCDGPDVGAVVDTGPAGGPAVYVYDRHPGGAGFARQAFEAVEQLVRAARDLVARCPCESGCPSCVGAPLPPSSQTDPDTTARGRVPDKAAALRLLEALLEPAAARVAEPGEAAGLPPPGPPPACHAGRGKGGGADPRASPGHGTSSSRRPRGAPAPAAGANAPFRRSSSCRRAGGGHGRSAGR
ncbi:MAG: DEAD/DEAH box helicase [Limnochordaceae bacterium]|nr:DEAD/DEAH box helicase [Limnochordaceae bacterium]